MRVERDIAAVDRSFGGHQRIIQQVIRHAVVRLKVRIRLNGDIPNHPQAQIHANTHQHRAEQGGRQGREYCQHKQGKGGNDARRADHARLGTGFHHQTAERRPAVDDKQAVEHVDASDVGLGHIGLLEEDRQKVVEKAHAEQGRRQQGQQDEGQEVAVRQQTADLRQGQSGGRGFLLGIRSFFLSTQQAQCSLRRYSTKCFINYLIKSSSI